MQKYLLPFVLMCTFLPVASGQVLTNQGIGGYDLSSPNDQMFAFDWDSSGKSDHIVLYRPASGIFWVLQNSGGTFTPVWTDTSNGGVGGYISPRPMTRRLPLTITGPGS